MIRVVVLGAHGWLGSAVAAAVDTAPGCDLVAGVGRETPDWEDLIADVVVDATEPVTALAHARKALTHGLHAVVLATSAEFCNVYAELGELAKERDLACAVVPNVSPAMALLESTLAALAGWGGSLRLVDIAAPGVPAPLQTTLFLAQLVERNGGGRPSVSSIRNGSAKSLIRVEWQRGNEILRLEHRADESIWGRGAVEAVQAAITRRGLLLGMSETIGRSGQRD